MVEIATTTSTSADLKKALSQMKQRFRTGVISLKTGSQHLTEDGAEELKELIEFNYDKFIGSLQNDHDDHTYYTAIMPRDGGGYDVLVTGPSVIYDEFGTGIVGYHNQHPKKGNHNLNGYNTGPKIIHHVPDSNKDYWVFYRGGKYYTSHGIPAGQFMYDSLTEMADGIWINRYIEKEFGDLYKIGGK